MDGQVQTTEPELVVEVEEVRIGRVKSVGVAMFASRSACIYRCIGLELEEGSFVVLKT